METVAGTGTKDAWWTWLVPGLARHPPDVVRRRFLIGVIVVVVVSFLQTLPTFQRGPFAAVFARFLVWTVSMLCVIGCASLVYGRSIERRAGMAKTMLFTISTAAVAGSVVMVGFWTTLQLFPSLRLADEPKLELRQMLFFGLIIGMLHCGLWALAFVLPYAVHDAHVRGLETEKLRAEAEQLRTAAELSRLRSQLEPHFLLNTLNAVAGLVTEDPREARRLLACLGDLLRDSLEEADELQPLQDEIAWLRRYAEILESRHAGVLSFEWDIDEAASSVLVPRLILQPLVENAVKHGALRRHAGGAGGRVVVRAHFAPSVDTKDPRGRLVVCSVEDNGPGLPDTAPRAGAFGIKSVRRRLELRYPDGRLQIESSEDGTRSVVEIPSPLPA